MVRSSPGLKPRTERGEGIEGAGAGCARRWARAALETNVAARTRIVSAVGAKCLWNLRALGGLRAKPGEMPLASRELNSNKDADTINISPLTRLFNSPNS